MQPKRAVMLGFAGASLVAGFLLDMWLYGLLIALVAAGVAVFAPLPED